MMSPTPRILDEGCSSRRVCLSTFGSAQLAGSFVGLAVTNSYGRESSDFRRASAELVLFRRPHPANRRSGERTDATTLLNTPPHRGRLLGPMTHVGVGSAVGGRSDRFGDGPSPTRCRFTAVANSTRRDPDRWRSGTRAIVDSCATRCLEPC